MLQSKTHPVHKKQQLCKACFFFFLVVVFSVLCHRKTWFISGQKMKLKVTSSSCQTLKTKISFHVAINHTQLFSMHSCHARLVSAALPLLVPPVSNRHKLVGWKLLLLIVMSLNYVSFLKPATVLTRFAFRNAKIKACLLL